MTAPTWKMAFALVAETTIAVCITDINAMYDRQKVQHLWQEIPHLLGRQCFQHLARHFARNGKMQFSQAPHVQNGWERNPRSGKLAHEVYFLRQIRVQHSIMVETYDILLRTGAESKRACHLSTFDGDEIG